MASARWSILPPDILSSIAKILNADVDILRLRTVCSSWRSSLRPRLRPSPFPLKLPPLLGISSITPGGGHFMLNYTTLYRLSPPEIGPYAGDPSEGWLFRVLEVNPNHFLILAPLLSRTAELPPGTVPKYLNLLDHRITKVCKCYSLSSRDDDGSGGCLDYNARKVIVLQNYAEDSEFVVIALFSYKFISYWKFGDKAWTRIDVRGYEITDVVVCNGKCYAISSQGVLVSFDSKLSLEVVPIPHLPVAENYLVEYKSELYAVSKICNYTSIGVSLQLKVFKKCKDKWERIRCLGNEMLLSTDDVSIGLCAEYFKGRGANCVYVAQTYYPTFPFSQGEGTDCNTPSFRTKGVTASDLGFYHPKPPKAG